MTSAKVTNASVADEAERLASAAAEAIERAAEAQARAEEARARAEERRRVEQAAIRRRRLDQYDETVLKAEEREAKAAFEAAVLDDAPSVGAFLEWQYHANKRYLLAVEARSAQQALDPEAAPIPTGGPSDAAYAEAVQAVVRRALANRLEDLRDVLQAELDGAGR